MKIVVLDAYTGNPGDLSWSPMSQLGELVIYDRTPRELIVERALDADAVLINKIVISRDIIEQLPRLKYVGVIATGFNIVDIEAAAEHGIVVTNVPAYSTPSVAQLAIAHMLNICCQVQHYTDEIRDGMWSRCPDFSFTDTRLTEMAGKTLGIVGLGQIGNAVARIALAMDMKVMAVTSKEASQLPEGIVKAESLDAMLPKIDVLSLHCPLTPETRGMIDARRLQLMKPTAIVINTSRGPLIQEDALAQALNDGTILAAGLDVMEIEPPKADNPLLRCPNCYMTPHIAWASIEARQRLMKVLTRNMQAFIEGHPENQVN